MNDYRIVYEYKGKEKTRIINAENEINAKLMFIGKLKESAKDLVNIKHVNLIEPVTNTFDFDNEIVSNFLQYYLEQADPDEYDLNCTMENKTTDENTVQALQHLQDFLKENYITKIQLVITGDKKEGK